MVQAAQVYETKDGKFFQNKTKAKNHERRIMLTEELKTLGQEENSETLEEVIMKRWDEISKLAVKYKNIDLDESDEDDIIFENGDEQGIEEKTVKRKVGRPKGSKNKTKNTANTEAESSKKAVKKRGPGRPKGSKNKPKRSTLKLNLDNEAA